jgi:hypothetical protein
MQLSDYESKSINKLGESIHNGNWSKDGMVQLIELCGLYLNIDTIPNYAKKTGISYNGVKKTRDIREIFNVKFVVE